MGPETTVAGLRRIFGSCLHCITFSGTALSTGILLLLATFAQNIKAQGPTQSPDQKVDQKFYTPKDRIEAIRVAVLLTPKAVGDADVLQGPPQNPKQFQFHPNDKVICDFDQPGSQMGGKTPKFSCKITRVESANGQVQVLTEQMVEEPVKVKFGAGDNEIYAEVVSTRLFWALGYYADSWFPVKVECHNCPSDPESGSGAKDTRSYDAATVVRKYPGQKMYEEGKSDQGWSWKELDKTTAGRFPRKTDSNCWAHSFNIATTSLRSSAWCATG